MSNLPRTPDEHRRYWSETKPDIPYGRCWCGCGQSTPITRQADARSGAVKGQPTHFLSGHNLPRLPEPPYKVEDRGYETSCWVWLGYLNRDGYGVLGWRGESRWAHRHFYTQRHGSTPAGYEYHHLCEVRACVRPEHLIHVTHKQNIRLQCNTKLTPEIAARIRRVREETDLSYNKLAVAFGVTKSTIHKIIKRRIWT